MAAGRRFEFLMDTDHYAQLCALARRRKTSVPELIRGAVRESYFKAPEDRKLLVDSILAIKLPNIDWTKAKKGIESAHAGALGSARK
jgi:hypothetical protein